jgi:hypothetical protein
MDMSYLPSVTLFRFGSGNTPLVLVTIYQTVIRTGRGVGTFSSDQITP